MVRRARMRPRRSDSAPIQPRFSAGIYFVTVWLDAPQEGFCGENRMMDYITLLYLAAFPVLTVYIGWSVLSRGLFASDDKLALRKVQRWRFVMAFCLFSVSWLLLVSAGMVVY